MVRSCPRGVAKIFSRSSFGFLGLIEGGVTGISSENYQPRFPWPHFQADMNIGTVPEAHSFPSRRRTLRKKPLGQNEIMADTLNVDVVNKCFPQCVTEK